ncbi:MAG: DEAD/DEAH box helicase [Kiritimatiellia bacterium]|jgi:ATP-dependent RNA helicase RhlB|nr:DEAD/DEAH box helicase [Kiritimatiellia bacterium]
MPLGFIKKIAGKLLGQQPQAPKKHQDKAGRGAKNPKREAPRDGRRGRPEGGRAKPQAPKEGPAGRQARGAPGRQGQGARGADAGRGKPRRESAGRGSETRPRREPGTPPVAAAARSVARPPSKEPRRGRGGERPVSDPHARRPGGAVGEAERAARLAEHAAWSPESFSVAPAEGKKRFQDFDLPGEILHAVADLGFQYCTPIQALSLEHALAGKNVAGKAQTGTGKTAAFLVAILTRYLRSPESRQQQGGAPRALVIAPTRELVIQICKDAAALGKYCGLRSLAVYGGMDYDRQKREVSDAPVDLLVATPGRLLDFVRSRVVDLSKVDTLVIDEADRMLDMGFIPDVRSIIARLPPKNRRGTMLYSATLTEDVMRLALQWMEAPVKVEVESEHVTTATVKQVVYVVTANEKFTVLYNHIQQYPDSRMLIFCNRRSTTEDVADSLTRRGIRCEMLSGDVNQNRRLRVLEDFREGRVRIVVATDVAGRGLHVDDIGFVVNFDFPYEPEDYVHRIGRTGRAGASGVAISFADEDESFIIPEIEKYIGEELKCTVLATDDPLLAKLPPKPTGRPPHAPPPEPANPRPAAPQRERAPEGGAAVRGDAQPRRSEPPHAGARADAAQPGEPAATKPEPETEPRKPERPPAAAAPRKPEPPPPPRRAEPPAARPAVTAAPHPAAAQRRPRFSEEWVPGQQSK